MTREVGHLASDMRVVIGTRIRLPDQLSWLWPHQWIDLRRWGIARLARQGLPHIPEGVTGVQFPLAVRIVHQLLCSLIGLLVYVTARTNQDSQDPSLDATAAMGAWIALVWLARGLVRRKIPESSFVRWWTVSTLVAIAIVIWETVRIAMEKAVWLPALPVGLFLVAMPLAFARLRPQVAFWFPAPSDAGTKPSETLSAGRDWQTLIWASVYCLAWALVFKSLGS